jgi:hypothetical protein
MTLDELFCNISLINDSTIVLIRDGETMELLAEGKWFQDNSLKYLDREVVSFTWQSDNKIYIDVK